MSLHLWLIFYGTLVGKHTIHGSYGLFNSCLKLDYYLRSLTGKGFDHLFDCFKRKTLPTGSWLLNIPSQNTVDGSEILLTSRA